MAILTNYKYLKVNIIPAISETTPNKGKLNQFLVPKTAADRPFEV
ncbi:hypothetical protein [Desulfogranum marinum]|nr:hypothetical protein [Desulfogranum marinum]